MQITESYRENIPGIGQNYNTLNIVLIKHQREELAVAPVVTG